jgi:hypothetical protein
MGKFGAGFSIFAGESRTAVDADETSETRVILSWLFLHPTQRHMAEHNTPDWKHSQYFFRHPDFLQLQPRWCHFHKFCRLASDLSSDAGVPAPPLGAGTYIFG